MKYKREQLTIKQDILGSGHGQIDCALFAYVDNTVVGALLYSVFNETPSVSMIEVLPEHQRKGVATLMIKELQTIYPEAEIRFGHVSSQGKALLDSIAFLKVENTERTKADAEYQNLLNERDTILQSLEERKLDHPDAIAGAWDRVNDLNDRLQVIAEYANNTKPYRRFVALDFVAMPDEGSASTQNNCNHRME